MFADQMNVDPPPTWVSVGFEVLAPDRTIVHFRHSGWGVQEAWQKDRRWQDAVSSGVFAELLKLP